MSGGQSLACCTCGRLKREDESIYNVHRDENPPGAWHEVRSLVMNPTGHRCPGCEKALWERIRKQRAMGGKA